jgi:hypothetical protein
MSIVMEQPEIERLGASLRPINPLLLKVADDTRVTRVWYQGGEPYFDVFFDVQGEQLVGFHLTLRGKSISWSQASRSLRTGSTNETRVNDTTYYAASKLIQDDHQVNPDFLALVRSLLQTRAGEPIFDQALALFGSEKFSA